MIGIAGRLAHSTLGRYIGRSTAETAGWVFEKGVSKGFLGMAGGGKMQMGALFGLGFTGISMYGGAKEGGAMGLAGSAAEMVGMQMASKLILNPVGLGVAAVGAAAFGAYKFGNAATQHRKELRETEMIGRNSINVINGAYTDRARSLAALNNSSMNARMALGNEAQMLHTSYSGISTFRR